MWEYFVMTKPAGERTEEERRCRWCRRALPARNGPGRPKQFCSQRCRQWDWVSRQRAAELQISEGELVVARVELDAVHDDLYVLACAVDDTERDLADAGDVGFSLPVDETGARQSVRHSARRYHDCQDTDASSTADFDAEVDATNGT